MMNIKVILIDKIISTINHIIPFEIMTQKSKMPGKHVLSGHNIRASSMRAGRNEPVGLQLSEAASKPIDPLHDDGAFRILGKDDIKKELARTKEIFGMNPDEFYKAWKEDKVHGFHALKFGCLYEFYRDEYL